MLEETQTTPEPSTTTAEPRKVKPKAFSDSTPAPEPGSSPTRKVHVVLQGKGGVGKTFIASLLAQYLMERGEPVICLDTDAVNASFRDIPALKADVVNLFQEGSDEIDVNAMDAMVERLLTEDSHFVVDNGATSFVPLSRYLIQDGIADALADAGRKLVVHTIIAGGQELVQTGKGFDSVAGHFPVSADIVLWLNEHHGPVKGKGTADFETTPLFQEHKDRVKGVVRLTKLHAQTFGANLTDMLSRRMTFAEAKDSSEFYTIAKQRLIQIKRPIFQQIDAVM